MDSISVSYFKLVLLLTMLFDSITDFFYRANKFSIQIYL